MPAHSVFVVAAAAGWVGSRKEARVLKSFGNQLGIGSARSVHRQYQVSSKSVHVQTQRPHYALLLRTLLSKNMNNELIAYNAKLRWVCFGSFLFRQAVNRALGRGDGFLI